MIMIKIFALLTGLFLFSSCESNINESQNKSTLSYPFQENKNGAEIKKTVILYASDSPNEFFYFSPFFTQKLNYEKIFRAVHDHDLNKHWITQSYSVKQNENIDAEINAMKNTLKSLYKNKSIDKMVNLNLLYENKLLELMAKNPKEVASHVLSEFLFWSAIAEIKGNQSSSRSLYFYQKTVSLSEKNLFEQEVDGLLLKQLQNDVQDFRKMVNVSSQNNCSIFINGKKLKAESVSLPIRFKSVFSASCSEGDFSLIFSPLEKNVINIDKLKVSSRLNVMPNLNGVMKTKIQNTKIDYLILVFWSKKLKYLEAKLIDTKNYKEIKKINLKLEKKSQFNEVSEKLIQIFKNRFPPSRE